MTRLACGARERMIVWTVAVVLAMIAAVVGLTVGLHIQPPPNGGSPVDPVDGRASRSRRHVPLDMDTTRAAVNSQYRTYRSAAITTDTNICADIGVNILTVHAGSAMDAAIASMMCVGVVNAHSTGLGGGHFATVYDTPRNGNEKVLVTVVSRERAPLLSYQDMFVNNTSASSKGGLSIAVPGEVMGFYRAWEMFGRVPWAELVQPTIDLCENGFIVEKDLSLAIAQYEEAIRADPNLSELFVKSDGTLVTEGDLLINQKLGTTFRSIALDPMTYYTGTLAQDIVADISEYGGIVSLEDLASYTTSLKAPLKVDLANGQYSLYNPPPPSSGVVLSFIAGIVDGYNFSPSDIVNQQPLTYHRIIESFKFAYAKRSELGDEDYVNVTDLVRNLTSPLYATGIRMQIDDYTTHDVEYYEPTFDYVQDSGTVHLNVLAEDGSAVAMSGTINLFFGSNVRGSRTGIIFNDEMDDFSTPGTVNAFGVPASPSNYIVPGKMPMSSMSPTLAFDNTGRVVFMSGGSGGTRITTGTAFVMMNSLWFELDLKMSTDTPRIHHQLVPNEVTYEPDLDPVVLEGLRARNHITTIYNSIAVVGSIRSQCGTMGGYCIEAVSDGRKGGVPSGY